MTLVRLVWVVLSIVPGGFIGGLVGYVVGWLIVPDSSEPALVSLGVRRLTRSVSDRKLAGVCGGLAEYLEVDSTVVRLVWARLTVGPGAIVLGVLAYLMAWFVMPTNVAPRVTAASAAA